MSDLHPHHEDHPQMISRAARRGLVLFFVYLALYAGFLFLTVYSPTTMGNTAIPLKEVPVGKQPEDVLHLSLYGLNVALVYGLGLIVVAILLALFYMHLTRPPQQQR